LYIYCHFCSWFLVILHRSQWRLGKPFGSAAAVFLASRDVPSQCYQSIEASCVPSFVSVCFAIGGKYLVSVSAAVKTEQRKSEETFLKVARDGNHEAVTTMVLYTSQLACPSV